MMERLLEQPGGAEPGLERAQRLLRASRPRPGDEDPRRKARVWAALHARQQRVMGLRPAWVAVILVGLLLGSAVLARVILGPRWGRGRPAAGQAPTTAQPTVAQPAPAAPMVDQPAMAAPAALPPAALPAALPPRAALPAALPPRAALPAALPPRAVLPPATPPPRAALPPAAPPPVLPDPIGLGPTGRQRPSALTQANPPVGRAPSTPSANPIPTEAESALVLAAVRALRREHDPGRAGVLLDDYLQTYPNGALAEEALALAVEAAAARGDRVAAQLARQYLTRYPAGRFQAAARRAQARFAAGQENDDD